ncbi:bis(5'-nucleosyl)-tetraphosphatase (symmetrical) YqeK [Clostridium sp. MSJ-4]|uniref:bis(5'-nucleosyl)-tetraphosphatase (symmetrical) n=1 Tax=Clostridium simiarum TaxID=2841506 RepID=A0ABS6F2H8_9CLOT|nr:bis(5'-nucleosyl)-tetraphosphatase (symmetrical) YqeK [Clostridium simiarum]MBU5592722.1 bis(5'-nucleosyl)-tetraphosphatase (symmetrical) YqeK [Clostridium simiarum]
MWTEDQISEYLKDNLKESRYNHVLRVVDTAEKLARIYGEDIKKARLAALIHDAAKNKTVEEILDIIASEGITLDEEISKVPQLTHGLAGAIIGKNLMGIEDEDVLNAAIYHTTGKENMTKLEKIIYVADYIEPGREFKGVEVLREEAFKDLDQALLRAFDNTIKYIVESGNILLTGTIKARNYLILNKSNR